jgi:hypothetical protein
MLPLFIFYQVEPDSRLYIAPISTCIEMNDLNTAALIISSIEKANLKPDIILQTTLVKAYSKLGDAKQVFKILKQLKVFCLSPLVALPLSPSFSKK